MPFDSSPLPCSILLLAGGRGQRMGGQDKGLLHWQGEPLIAHLQRLTRPLTDDLIISCNRNHEHYAAYADQLGGIGLTCSADDPRLANLNTPELLLPRPGVSE